MIRSLEINGFKSFVSQNIELSPLTILTGLNSSGKSSVIQSIRILSRVANSEKESLLDGHGTIEELKNPFVDNGIKLKAIYENTTNRLASITFPAETEEYDINNNFPEVIYISADRFGPQTSIPIATNHNLGPKGENILNCIDFYQYEQLNSLLKHQNSEGETFGFNLEAWLGAISPGVKFKHEIQKLTDSSYTLFNGHRAMNVGFGLSYTLPIIVALFLGTIKPNTIVLLENPEAHLHPKGQTELSKLIALAVQAGAQVIVETHSDHLFDGIRVFAKQHNGFAKDVNIYWFELDQRKNTNIEASVLDDNGRLDKWPDGLFDQFEINASELL
ncbi:DUF3696 domain-containing protein [uncultured Bacteroides sp.]|uniref:AAA family ATPase n=1 Tax=uncultured Bacteroides sp. TaxID=162156 RepID=UPI0025EB9E54|nr:DUF3696 domain-containing protein [uncultured Bacteroides sp.]